MSLALRQTDNQCAPKQANMLLLSVCRCSHMEAATPQELNDDLVSVHSPLKPQQTFAGDSSCKLLTRAPQSRGQALPGPKLSPNED